MKKEDLLEILGCVQTQEMSTHEAAEKIIKASSESQSVRDNEEEKEFCPQCKNEMEPVRYIYCYPKCHTILR